MSARVRLLAGLVSVLATAGLAAGVLATEESASPAAAHLVSSAGVHRHDYAIPGGRRIIAFWNPRELRTARPASQPWIAYVHGGGWRFGAVDEPTALEFCDRMVSIGFTCFSLDYTLLPKAAWPTQSVQVEHELAWVRRHGNVFKLRPQLGFAAGHSAGALMAGVAGLGDGHLAGIVSLAGATNVPYVARHNPDRRVAHLARLEVRNRPLTSALARSAEVIAHVTSRTARVPYLVVHERDDPAVGVQTSRLLAGQLRHRGFPVTLDVVPGHSHECNVSGPGVRAVEDWLLARVAAVRRQSSAPARAR